MVKSRLKLPFQLHSINSFEFYAGVVEIHRDSRELLVTWDVRSWLREVVVDELNLSNEEAPREPVGFRPVAAEFSLIAR